MKGPIARATVRTSAVLGLRLLVQAGTLLLVARMLGPEQFGAFAGVSALAVMLGTLSTFGTHLILLGEVSKSAGSREHVLAYALPVTLLVGSLLLALYLTTCSFFFASTLIAPSALAALGLAELILQPLIGLCTAEHHGLGRIARSQLLAISPMTLRLAVAGLIFLFRPSDLIASYAYGCTLGAAAALAFSLLTLPARWPPFTLWRLPSAAELRNAAGYAALAVTAASPAELDKALATRLLPLTTGGLYCAGARVVGSATLPISAMLFAALPRLFREGRSKPERALRLVRHAFSAAALYSILLSAALWALAPVFVWLFGPQYVGLDTTIHWLCLAVPAMALRMTAGGVLMAAGKPWERFSFEVAGLAALGILAPTMTSELGSKGMTLSLAASEWIMATLGIILVRKSFFGIAETPLLQKR